MVKINDLDAATLSGFADYKGHERVVHVTDAQSGLNAFIGIHSRAIGPSLGGCRMRPYATERDAIQDVLRLSRGMTYKNALAGLPLGGGKSVIIADPYKGKTDAMMRAMGQAIEMLGGAYITAEDSGTGEHDMITMLGETSYVCGIPGDDDSALGGNPSPVTAYGTYAGIKAAALRRFDSDDLAERSVSVQGLGSVGYDLCRLLHNDGAVLFATDTRSEVTNAAAAEFERLTIVGLDEIFDVQADIFAPCALGAQINDNTVPRLKTDIVAGAANNQLATMAHGDALEQRGILYVPDYVINAGGVIAVAYEYFSRSGRNPFSYPLTREAMMDHVGRIGPTVTRIIERAEADGVTTAVAADREAEAIFMGGRKLDSAA